MGMSCAHFPPSMITHAGKGDHTVVLSRTTYTLLRLEMECLEWECQYDKSRDGSMFLLQRVNNSLTGEAIITPVPIVVTDEPSNDVRCIRDVKFLDYQTLEYHPIGAKVSEPNGKSVEYSTLHHFPPLMFDSSSTERVIPDDSTEPVTSPSTSKQGHGTLQCTIEYSSGCVQVQPVQYG